MALLYVIVRVFLLLPMLYYCYNKTRHDHLITAVLSKKGFLWRNLIFFKYYGVLILPHNFLTLLLRIEDNIFQRVARNIFKETII